jgi:hypothetical protein
MEDAHNDDDAIVPVLKGAVDDSARLLGSFVEEDEEHFETPIVDIDNRVLQTVKSFFDILSKDSATLRIISGDSERNFDFAGIARAAERANATRVEAIPETIEGLLQGVMPDKHEFELRTEGRTLIGKVASAITGEYLSSLFNKQVRAEFSRTVVFRGLRLVRQKYEMLSVAPEEDAVQESFSTI